MNKENKMSFYLWISAVVLAVGLLITRVVFPELLWLTLIATLLLVIVLAALIRENQKALRSRSTAFGVNSFVTVLLVISIVGVLNFLASRHPFKADLTQNKIHTLSDQT